MAPYGDSAFHAFMVAVDGAAQRSKPLPWYDVASAGTAWTETFVDASAVAAGVARSAGRPALSRICLISFRALP